MNCIFLRKTFSIAAAFLLCSTLTRMPVSAAPEPEAQAEAVPMIVLLDAKPEDAAEEKAEQERVFAEICARYPQAEMRCRFTELLNGFSCTFPESCADAVRAIPGVASAERCGTAKLTPMLADAARLGGIPQFYEETDCTGEGKVICIIDTELDVTHPMFAPLADGVAAKLTKEDIAEIADTVGFSREIDPDLAYVNSKVPFAIDYLDNDRYALANTREKAYHGTHVAGIAAGNEYTDPDGKTISGIAKNAQIVFMAIDNFLTPDEDYYQEHYLDAEFSEQYLYDTIIAALDDAAKLHADAVNMSFGSTGPEMNADDALIRAIKAAEEAGMTVCISAGNDGSQSMGMLPAENPSHSTLNSFICENGGALAIASAENDASREAGVLLFQGEPIIYNAYYTSTFAPEPTYLGDVLPAGEYEYVDCGRGFEEDFAGKDLTGKIALIRRDTQFFSNMAILSEKAHAVGVIVCNKVDDIRNYMAGTEQIPMALISLSDGERLFSAAEKKITVTPDRQSILLPTAVSDFTSWGTNSSLELRPDIMGVGGAVESAAYGGETAMLSGTSMSSPYLAGCAVLLSEYLDRNGCTLTGEARQRYMRNLLMTGAVPYKEEGLYISPRRQGAGMVSLKNATATKVILTGTEGESKISLRDGLGTSFSFPVTMTNISQEDVTFASAELLLTTDTAHLTKRAYAPQNYSLNSIQALSCTADCSGLTQIAAGESKDVRVSVNLDPAQADEIRKVFRYGFYIEGYLLLSGAENNVDISVPVFGFSDKMADIPLISDVLPGTFSFSHERIGTRTLLDFAGEVQDYCETVLTEKQREYLELFYQNNETMNTSSVENSETEIYRRLTGPEFEEATEGLQQIKDRLEDQAFEIRDPVSPVYISPEHGGFANYPAFFYQVLRPFRCSNMKICDMDGNTVCSDQYYKTQIMLDEFYYMHGFSLVKELGDLAEGSYTFEMDLDSADAYETHEKISIPFIVDVTDPEVTVKQEVIDGRVYLTLTASDNVLDGFVFCGISAEDAGKEYGRVPLFYLLEEKNLSGRMVDYYGTGGRGPAYVEPIDLPPLGKLLIGNFSANAWVDQFDEFTFQKAEPDENGMCTVTYDVTDYKGYSINVLDRAGNITEIEKNTDNPTAANPNDPRLYQNPVKPGVYKVSTALIEITEDEFYVMPFEDVSKAFRYTYEYQFDYDYYRYPRERVQLIVKGESPAFSIEAPVDIVISEDGTIQLEHMPYIYGYDFQDVETLYPTEYMTADDYLAIGIDEAEQILTADYAAAYADGRTPSSVTRTVLPEGIVEYQFSYFVAFGVPVDSYVFTVDLKTGIAEMPDGTKVQLPAKAKHQRGDVTCDGKVDVADAVLLARYLAEDRDAVIEEAGKVNADADLNGNTEPADIRIILIYIANLYRTWG